MPKTSYFSRLSKCRSNNGLDEKEDGDKKIFLSFKGKGDDVEITVRDNGLGMEQEKAETLVTYQAKGYGLKNVNDRIRLLYGENYGIHIFSSPDERHDCYYEISEGGQRE